MFNSEIRTVRPGLLLAMLTLLFGIGMGVAFGVNEDGIKGWIAQSVDANAQAHDAKSQSKIWRYAQRAHFHATGVGAFTLGMILLVAFTSMKPALKRAVSVLLGIGGFYSLAWLSMLLLAPSMGRGGAHDAPVTEAIVVVTVGCLLVGIGVLLLNLLFDFGADRKTRSGHRHLEAHG